MTAKERAWRYRARKRGEAVPKVRGGPKLGYRQTEEHIAKRMNRYVERVVEGVPKAEKALKDWEADRELYEERVRERTLVDMEASPEVEENGVGERVGNDVGNVGKSVGTEPPNRENWREKRLGAKVIWQCRACGTWWGARHTVNCRYGEG